MLLWVPHPISHLDGMTDVSRTTISPAGITSPLVTTSPGGGQTRGVGENPWIPTKTPLGVVSTDAIELLTPFVPSRDEPVSRKRLRSRQGQRRWISRGGAERTVVTAMSLMFFDLLALTCCFASVSLIGATAVATLPSQLLTSQLFFASVSYLAIGYLLGLFPATAIGPIFELRQLVMASSLSFALTMIFALLAFPLSLSVALIGICACLAGIVVLPLTRALSRHYLSRYSWWGERVVVIGSGVQGQAIYKFYRRAVQRGLRPVGIVDRARTLDDAAQVDSLGLFNGGAGDPYLGPVSHLSRLARRHSVRWGIIAPGGCDGMDTLEVLNFSGSLPNLIILPSEFSLPSLWASPRECAGVMGIHVQDHLRNPLKKLCKRVFDIVGASIGLLLSVPLFVIAAVWIKLKSPGPIIYGHSRVGMDSKAFKVWKFRTMVPNADSVLEEHLSRDPEMRQAWFEDQKLRNDPRVIQGIGNFLRKSSLDEIPQLWNVLKGDMSLVGPRPIVTKEIGRYQEMISLYLRVRPGLTGLWQISGRNNTSYEQRVRLDSYYICNWSIWLDIYIILRTIRTVLRQEGAY